MLDELRHAAHPALCEGCLRRVTLDDGAIEHDASPQEYTVDNGGLSYKHSSLSGWTDYAVGLDSEGFLEPHRSAAYAVVHRTVHNKGSQFGPCYPRKWVDILGPVD